MSTAKIVPLHPRERGLAVRRREFVVMQKPSRYERDLVFGPLRDEDDPSVPSLDGRRRRDAAVPVSPRPVISCANG